LFNGNRFFERFNAAIRQFDTGHVSFDLTLELTLRENKCGRGLDAV